MSSPFACAIAGIKVVGGSVQSALHRSRHAGTEGAEGAEGAEEAEQWWCQREWVRCGAPWGEIGQGNTLDIFHEATTGMYRCEMQLEADSLELIALLRELNFADTWCPFVRASDRLMDAAFLLNSCVVFHVTVEPFCRLVLGIVCLCVKQTCYSGDGVVCVQYEDMHVKTRPRFGKSYFCFDPFAVKFERNRQCDKTCCSFEIRVTSVFAYVPSVFLFAVSREMFACILKHWTVSARLLKKRSLDLFALRKQMQCDAVRYDEIATAMHNTVTQ